MVWYHSIPWYTMVYRFQFTVVAPWYTLVKRMVYHGIPWVLPWFTSFKIPSWYTEGLTTEFQVSTVWYGIE